MALGVLQLKGELSYNKDGAVIPMGPIAVGVSEGNHGRKFIRTVGPSDLQLDLDGLATIGIVMFHPVSVDGSPQVTPAPVISSVSNAGTPGSGHYGYRIVGRYDDGSYSARSARVDTSTGSGVLDGTNYNIVTWDNIGLFDSFDIYRLTEPPGSYYLQFQVAFSAAEIAGADSGDIVTFTDPDTGINIHVRYDFGAGAWVYSLGLHGGASSDTFTASVTADTFVTIDLEIDWSGGGVIVRPKFDGTAATVIANAGFSVPPTELRIGAPSLPIDFIGPPATLGTANNRSFKNVKLGTTAYGSSNLFSAPLNSAITPDFDTAFDPTDLSIVSSDHMLANPPDGTAAYALKTFPFTEVSHRIANVGPDVSSINDQGDIGVNASAPTVGVAPIKPVVKMGTTAGDYLPGARLNEFSVSRWRHGAEIHLIAPEPIVTEIVVIESTP